MISKKYNFQKHIQVEGLNLPLPPEARQTINVKSQIEILKHLYATAHPFIPTYIYT